MRLGAILIWLLCGLSAYGQGNVQLVGQLSRATTDSVYLRTQHHFIGFLPELHSTRLEGGAFRFSLQLEQPALVVLHVGDEQIPLFLHPWDSLHLSGQAGSLLTNLSFNGLGKVENSLLQELRRDFFLHPEQRLYPEAYRYPDANDFLRQWERRAKKLEKWLRDVKKTYSVSRSFTVFLEHHLQYQQACELTGYASYRQFTELSPLSEDGLFEQIDAVPRYAPEALATVYAYTRFLEDFLHYKSTPKYEAEYFKELYQTADTYLKGEVRAHMQARILAKAWQHGYAEALTPSYQAYRQRYNDSPYLGVLHHIFRQQAHNATGKIAPDFEAKDIQGQTRRRSDWKGRYNLIVFWRTDCMSCLPDLERISRMRQQFSEEEIAFIFVALDAESQDWKDYLQKKPLEGIHLHASGIFSEPARRFQIDALPAFFLITPEGRFAPTPVRPTEGLRQALRQELNR